MELDARGHGYDGKLHADRWTAEYVGRGNHALDAACFRATRAVSGRTVVSVPPPAAERSAHGRSTDAAVRALRVFYYEAQVLSTGGEGAADAEELDARQLLVRRAHLMSASALAGGAARSAAERPYSSEARAPWRERARQLVQARVQGASAPAVAASNPEPGTRSHAVGSPGASAENDAAMEGEALAAERAGSGRSAWRLYQASSSSSRAGNGGGASGSAWLEAEMEDEEDEESDAQYYQALARDMAAARRGDRALGGGGMHFAFSLSSRAQQQLRPRYERRRARRRSEKKRFDHRVAVGFSLGKLPLRMNVRAGRGPTDEAHLRADDDKIPLGHEDLGQSARSLAYVGRTGRVVSNGTEYLECDKYGVGDVVGCGVLLDSMTFFFTLNGKLMGMVEASDVHHLDVHVDDDGAGDASDCLASAFDWSESDTGDRSDGDGSDMDGDESMSDADSATEEDDELYPSVSLHRPGECVRAVFAPAEFKFDLYNFQKQVLKERQRSLGSEALPGARQTQEEDDAVMSVLVLDYFKHCGYDGAFKAMQASMQAASAPLESTARQQENGFCEENYWTLQAGDAGRRRSVEDSLGLRSEVRRRVRCFETARALELIERLPSLTTLESTRRYQRVRLYCHMLCVLDAAQPKPATSKASASLSSQAMNGDGAWSAEKAIACAQSVFAAFTSRPSPSSADIGDTALRDDLALFMSVLLHGDPSKLPADSCARLFLTSEFRERVADELNSMLLSVEAVDGASTPRSSLETFLDDVEAMRATSLRHGCRVFPESAASLSAQLSASRKRKEQQRRAQMEDGGEDDELSSGLDDSSSSTSSRRRVEDEEEDEEEE